MGFGFQGMSVVEKSCWEACFWFIFVFKLSQILQMAQILNLKYQGTFNMRYPTFIKDMFGEFWIIGLQDAVERERQYP